METQDHKKLNPSGSGEYGGVHVCPKCGWPFPNPHPSARHRRAHKRVCGTIDGYRLDNNASKDKDHADGIDGEHNSDDDLKTPSEKVIERTINRRSSSGVGSRSSRSTRSEDDMFTDAVTEFNETPAIPATVVGEGSQEGLQRFYSVQTELADIKPAAVIDFNVSPAPVAEEASRDGLQRFYSMKNETEVNDVKPAEGNLNADDVSAPAALLDSLLPTLEQKVTQSSQLSSELDLLSERDIEFMLSKNAELRTSYNDTKAKVAKEVSFSDGFNDEQRGATDELLDSVSAVGLVKPTLKDSYGVEDETEKLNQLDSLGKDEIEGCSDSNSPGNFPSSVVQLIDSRDGNSSQSNIIEDSDSQISDNDNAHVLAASVVSPLLEHPEVAVEDLDQKTGKLNATNAPDTTVASVVYIKATTIEEGSSDFGFVRSADSDRVFSEDTLLPNAYSIDGNVKHGGGQNSAVEQKTSEEATDIPDVKALNGGMNVFRSVKVLQDKSENDEENNNSFAEEQKPITLLENVFPEGAFINNAHTRETLSAGDVQASNTIENNAELANLIENDDSKVSEDDSAVCHSVSSKLANDGIPLQVEEVISSHKSNGMGKDENITVGETDFGAKEVISGGELENESVNAETGPAYGLSLAGSHVSIDEPEETGRDADSSKLDMIINSGKVMEGHSHEESLPTSECVGKVEDNCENARQDERIADDGATVGLKSDDLLDSTSNLEIAEDAESSRQCSAAVSHISNENSADSTSSTQGDRAAKQPVVVSIVDTIVDSGSQTDSLDGNWGSISVKSAASDAQPPTDSHASNNAQALVEENGSNLDLKPVLENQQSQIQTSVEPEVGFEQTERASEIQTTDEPQQINSALQATGSVAVAHVTNEPHRGNKDEDIIAKVTNWDAGKQHTPLKTLLGEATAKSRAESPLHHSQISSSVPQGDDNPVTNNGVSAKTENVIPSVNNSETEAGQIDMGKEWNSPARYPVNINTEKRKTKSKPIWAPFLCCSSVNAR